MSSAYMGFLKLYARDFNVEIAKVEMWIMFTQEHIKTLHIQGLSLFSRVICSLWIVNMFYVTLWMFNNFWGKLYWGKS